MEDSIQKQSKKDGQKFMEKYGMWLMLGGLTVAIVVLKILLNIFYK